MNAALARKYNEEREKRSHAFKRHNSQNLRSMSPDYINRDPFANYDLLRNQQAPLRHNSQIKFLIAGGGHSGLLFAYHLRNAGFAASDICIVDAAGGLGGTWYWNRYPGLTCDVEGYSYLPLLEETGYVPRYRYSPGREIRENCELIAKKFDIRAMLCTKVTEAVWDDKSRNWRVALERQLGKEPERLTVHAQFFIAAGGVFFSPQVPTVDGLAEFERSKRVLHTARWDYSWTGGSEDQPVMTDLRNKTIGIIGTGATAVQLIPELAKWAKHLYVFQRTPSYCGPRQQEPTTADSWRKIADKEGWQRERQENLNRCLSNDPPAIDLVNDGWSHHRSFAGLLGTPQLVTPESLQVHVDSMLEMDVSRAESIREHIQNQVLDPATAEKLKPWYPGWCKRPTFHDSFLAAFNRPNVTLVDIAEKGIERFTDSSLIANGKEFELDGLVLATGFSSVSSTEGSPSARIGAPIVGRTGRSLEDKWKSKDFGTFFSVATNEFPNLFFYGIAGGPATANHTVTLDQTAKLVAHIIRESMNQSEGSPSTVIEVTKRAEDLYTDEVQSRALCYSVVAQCTPTYFTGYQDLAAQNDTDLGRKATWGSGPVDWARKMEEYLVSGDLGDFEISA